MNSLGIRRNDYIAAIRSEMLEVQEKIASYSNDVQDAKDLIQYCKMNKLYKFKKVIKLELKTLKKKQKMNIQYEKHLQKLLYLAERYAPGTREVN